MGAAGLVLNPKPRNESPPFLCFSLECAHDSASQEREAERVPSFTHKFDELRFFFFLLSRFFWVWTVRSPVRLYSGSRDDDECCPPFGNDYTMTNRQSKCSNLVLHVICQTRTFR